MAICSVAVPLKLLVGWKLSPFMAALISATLPVMVTTAVPLPDKVPVSGAIGTVIVPLVAVRITCTVAKPASGSLVVIRFPFPLEKTRGCSSFVCCAPGI